MQHVREHQDSEVARTKPLVPLVTLARNPKTRGGPTLARDGHPLQTLHREPPDPNLGMACPTSSITLGTLMVCERALSWLVNLSVLRQLHLCIPVTWTCLRLAGLAPLAPDNILLHSPLFGCKLSQMTRMLSCFDSLTTSPVKLVTSIDLFTLKITTPPSNGTAVVLTINW